MYKAPHYTVFFRFLPLLLHSSKYSPQQPGIRHLQSILFSDKTLHLCKSVGEMIVVLILNI